MGLSNFYTIASEFAKGAFYAHPAQPGSNVERYALGVEKPPGPVSFKRASGARLYDWVGTGFPVAALVSERLINVLQQGKCTGWSTYPVELSGRDQEPIEGYSGLVIRGRCGPIDDSRTLVSLEPSPYTGQMVPVRTGYYFDLSTWDGSEFFIAAGTTLAVVTQRVRDLLVKEKISNVVLEGLTQVKRIGA